MERKTIAVTGMSCGGCERNVESAVGNLKGVNRVEANHEGETVEVVLEDDVSDEEVEAAIEDAGFEVSA